MYRNARSLALALLAAAAAATATACTDDPAPTAGAYDQPSAPAPSAGPAVSPAAVPASGAAHPELERIARRLARALQDSAFRAYVKDALDRSPVVEHKLHLTRFLDASDGRALRAVARLNEVTESELASELSAAIPLELYLPVPAHRSLWRGGTDLLVATARADREVPIAFDLKGRRYRLSPDQPPATPVLAVVPVETDFDAAERPRGPEFQTVCPDGSCPGGDGDGGTKPSSGTVGTALYLTHAEFVQSFEGWLKGSPEFEIHIMGPAAPGDTVNLASVQCIGEHAPTGYTWDMNNLAWDGSVRLFTYAQMDAFERAHPGRAYVIMAYEDDDTACGIRTDSDRAGALLRAIGQAYQDYKGAKDVKVFTINGVTRIVNAARSGSSLLSALYSFVTSADDIIGVAVSDAVTGRYNERTNWTVLDKSQNTNGRLKLVVQ